MSSDAQLPPRQPEVHYNPRDLEYLTTLLEVSAILLTPALGATFTFEGLLSEVRKMSDDADERDLRIVLQNHTGFVRVPGKRWQLR